MSLHRAPLHQLHQLHQHRASDHHQAVPAHVETALIAAMKPAGSITGKTLRTKFANHPCVVDLLLQVCIGNGRNGRAAEEPSERGTRAGHASKRESGRESGRESETARARQRERGEPTQPCDFD